MYIYIYVCVYIYICGENALNSPALKLGSKEPETLISQKSGTEPI